MDGTGRDGRTDGRIVSRPSLLVAFLSSFSTSSPSSSTVAVVVFLSYFFYFLLPLYKLYNFFLWLISMCGHKRSERERERVGGKVGYRSLLSTSTLIGIRWRDRQNWVPCRAVPCGGVLLLYSLLGRQFIPPTIWPTKWHENTENLWIPQRYFAFEFLL